MQNRIKKCATVVLLAATTVAFVPMTAMADRADVQHSRVDRGAKVKVVKQQRHRPIKLVANLPNILNCLKRVVFGAIVFPRRLVQAHSLPF